MQHLEDLEKVPVAQNNRLALQRTGAPAAAELQAAGFISYSRGHSKINNRDGLERAASECYGATRYGSVRKRATMPASK